MKESSQCRKENKTCERYTMHKQSRMSKSFFKHNYCFQFASKTTTYIKEYAEIHQSMVFIE